MKYIIGLRASHSALPEEITSTLVAAYGRDFFKKVLNGKELVQTAARQLFNGDHTVAVFGESALVRLIKGMIDAGNASPLAIVSKRAVGDFPTFFIDIDGPVVGIADGAGLCYSKYIPGECDDEHDDPDIGEVLPQMLSLLFPRNWEGIYDTKVGDAYDMLGEGESLAFITEVDDDTIAAWGSCKDVREMLRELSDD